MQRNALVYKRTWRSSIFFSFLHPLLFLLAMGLGLGSLLRARGTAPFGGFSYLEFVAPGVLAAACMQTATFECSFPIITKISWQRNYEAMLATPLSVFDLLTGELVWIGMRVAMVAAAFIAITALFGVPQTPAAAMALPAAVLTGLAFAAPIMGFSATRKSYNDLSGLFRFVITPMFLFSGTFFPGDRLPEALRVAAYASPLYQGVELIRGSMLGSMAFSDAIGHIAYLALVLLFGVWYARSAFRRRLAS